MKTHWISISAAILLSFAGGRQAAAQEPAKVSPLELARQTGCLECHSVEESIIGPAWRDVAARYGDDAKAREQLVQTVRNGGKGNWTRVTKGVPMPPHRRRLKPGEISLLVDWILSLDSENQ